MATPRRGDRRYLELAAAEAAPETELEFFEGAVSWAKPSDAHEARYYRTYWPKGNEDDRAYRYLSLVTPEEGLIDHGSR